MHRVAQNHDHGHGLSDGPPHPRMTLATTPDRAAGIKTRQIVCQWVAPRERAPSLKVRGRALRESSEMLIIVGRIMRPKTKEPARTLKPGPPRCFRIMGTRTINPQKPINHRRNGCQKLNRGAQMPSRRTGASARREKWRRPTPRGTPTINAPRVTQKEPIIMG